MFLCFVGFVVVVWWFWCGGRVCWFGVFCFLVFLFYFSLWLLLFRAVFVAVEPEN